MQQPVIYTLGPTLPYTLCPCCLDQPSMQLEWITNIQRPIVKDSSSSGTTFLSCPLTASPSQRSMDRGSPDCVWIRHHKGVTAIGLLSFHFCSVLVLVLDSMIVLFFTHQTSIHQVFIVSHMCTVTRMYII